MVPLAFLGLFLLVAIAWIVCAFKLFEADYLLTLLAVLRWTAFGCVSAALITAIFALCFKWGEGKGIEIFEIVLSGVLLINYAFFSDLATLGFESEYYAQKDYREKYGTIRLFLSQSDDPFQNRVSNQNGIVARDAKGRIYDLLSEMKETKIESSRFVADEDYMTYRLSNDQYASLTINGAGYGHIDVTPNYLLSSTFHTFFRIPNENIGPLFGAVNWLLEQNEAESSQSS